jgi:dihydrofolate reductase
MGKLLFGMMQSLDGYIAGTTGGPQLPAPGPELHRHFNDRVRGLAGIFYGRHMYEVMRYWDDDRPDWEEIEHSFAAAWRSKPKWVASRSLKAVGANATLVSDDLEAFARRLKADVDGEIGVAGPRLAASLSALGLIDEYRLYFRPFVLGDGKPYFATARPPLRLVKTDFVGEDATTLTFVPAFAPPPNTTGAEANVSYYKPGTPMEDNIHLFVRAPKNADGFFTIEDAANNVLAWGPTLEDIAVKWRQMDVHKTIVEGLQRQTSGSSHRLLAL